MITMTGAIFFRVFFIVRCKNWTLGFSEKAAEIYLEVFTRDTQGRWENLETAFVEAALTLYKSDCLLSVLRQNIHKRSKWWYSTWSSTLGTGTSYHGTTGSSPRCGCQGWGRSHRCWRVGWETAASVVWWINLSETTGKRESKRKQN